jgi:hypothetical protein
VLGILDFKKLFANASHTVIITFKNATLLANMYNVSYMFVDERRFTQRVKKNKKKNAPILSFGLDIAEFLEEPYSACLISLLHIKC